jgi:hypothetical protein
MSLKNNNNNNKNNKSKSSNNNDNSREKQIIPVETEIKTEDIKKRRTAFPKFFLF